MIAAPDCRTSGPRSGFQVTAGHAASPRANRVIRTIADVAAWNLCTGCGACQYACERGAVTLTNIEAIGIRPVASDCGSCSACLSFCPGYQIDGDAGGGIGRSAPHAEQLGPYLEIQEGFATDPEIRFHGSSGGILSSLALYCLERENMDFVHHVAMDESAPWLNPTVQSRTRRELLQRAGSRYAPASPCDSLELIENSRRPCVFIGKPCDVQAIAKLRAQRPQLDRKLGLVLTFFCAGTPSTRGTVDLMDSLGVPIGKASSVRYRGRGWPGQFAVREADGETKTLGYAESWSRLTGYRPLRCHLCPDGLGWAGDISCGDAWDKSSDGGDGRSIVIARTQRGREILCRAREAGYLNLEPADAETVIAAQPGLTGRQADVHGRVLARRLMLAPSPRFRNYPLLRLWMRLPLMRKARTIGGTLVRMVRKRQWRAPEIGFAGEDIV